LNIVLLNTHNIFPAEQVGGIEKRIEAFIKYCIKENILLQIYSSKKINIQDYQYIKCNSDTDFAHKIKSILKNKDKVISYNLGEEACKILDNSNIKLINANCSGLAKNQRPQNIVYSSENIKSRFLSLNQMKSYENYYNKEHSCVIPHGLCDEDYFFDEKEHNKKYFLWCASLGWGLQPKGLDLFINLAKLNPEDKFIAYGAPWNSNQLEDFLRNLNLPNFSFQLTLKDEDKNKVFSNAIALCQFTRLIESCNIITLESYSRGTPVVSLDEDQGGVTNNSKFFDFTMQTFEDFKRLKNKALRIDRKQIFDYAKDKFHCKNEYNQLIQEFTK
jgi:hypothetical protein